MSEISSIYLPTVYARSNKGKVLSWGIEIQGNKYRTITGQVDGKQTVAAWTEAKPTNEGRANARTAEEQALFEARAKRTKKIEQGGYFENITDIDSAPKFIRPMLAESYVDFPEHVKYPTMVDRKYNGMRQVTSTAGALSRKGIEIISAPHIKEILAPLFEKHPDLVLDGELYNHIYRHQLNELMSILRTENPTAEDLQHSKEIVKYYVYDGYGFTINNVTITEQTPCIERRLALQELLKDIEYIVPVEFFRVDSEEELLALYEYFVSDGYEGAIIRNPYAPYHHRRHRDLLKLKPENDAEGVIIAIHEGTGNWAGVAKTATIKWHGRKCEESKNPEDAIEAIFDATFLGSREGCRAILENPTAWIGRTVTFKFNGYTGKDTPNYAGINPKNCDVAH